MSKQEKNKKSIWWKCPACEWMYFNAEAKCDCGTRQKLVKISMGVAVEVVKEVS